MSDVLPDINGAIAEYGRTMVLRRRIGTTNAFTGVTLKGILRAYKPGELLGDIAQGDAQVVISNREIAMASWPGPPRRGDQFVIDGRIWTLQGSTPSMLGEVVLVHQCWVRGG